MKNDINRKIVVEHLKARKGGKSAVNRFYCIILRFACNPPELMARKNLHMKVDDVDRDRSNINIRLINDKCEREIP